MACRKCGDCCVKFSVFGVSLYNKDSFLKKYPFLSYAGLSGLEIDRPVPVFDCSRLTIEIDGTRVCSDYKNRPNFCRNHPSSERTRSVGCTAFIVSDSERV